MPKPFPMDLVDLAITSETGEGPLGRALRALGQAAAASAAAVSSGGPSTWTYVAKNGSNLTGQRGNLDAPFFTIQGAVNATLDGDTIFISPGTYAENVVIPVGRTSLAFRGTLGNTFLAPVVAGAALAWLPTGNAILDIADLDIATTAGAAGIVFTSIKTATTNLIMSRVRTKGLTLTRLFKFTLDDCNVHTNPLAIVDVAQGLVRTCLVEDSTTLSFTPSTAQTIVRPVFFEACVLLQGALGGTAALSVSGAPQVFCDSATILSGGNAFVTPAPLSTATIGASITILGAILGGFQLNAAPLFGPGTQASSYSFNGAHFSGDATFAQSGGADPNGRAAVDARGAMFDQNVHATFTIDLDIRGGTYVQSLLDAAGGTGTINRDSHQILNVAIAAGGGTTSVAITPKFPDANYVPIVIAKTAAPVVPWATLTYTSSSFLVQPGGAGGFTADISVQKIP